VRAGAVAAGLDVLEHQQLGPVQVGDDRDARGDALGRLVERRQVVEVEHVGAGGVRRREVSRPGGDLVLVGAVVQRAHDPIRRARAVLVGRMKRGIGQQRIGCVQGAVKSTGRTSSPA
jgi:hypothetical protein